MSQLNAPSFATEMGERRQKQKLAFWSLAARLLRFLRQHEWTIGSCRVCRLLQNYDLPAHWYAWPRKKNLSRAFAAYIYYSLALHLERKVISSGPVYELYHQHSISFTHILSAIPVARRLCKTTYGRFGLVPLLTKPEDIICIFVGAEMPYVLRPTGNGTHTLIRPCYIDGIMDGEAVASGEYQNQDIILV
jgi:hypothetical protein